MFNVLAQDSKARRGQLTTSHGVIETPAFMPVGTQGAVKTVSPGELQELGAEIILSNTYHLFVRPGLDVIRNAGGLHRFMNWSGPILTDSGGYQIFSLAKLRKITEQGAHFQNHLDGKPTFISPEIVIEIQMVLGSDIVMVLDECVPYPCERDYASRSLDLTTRWAQRSKAAFQGRGQLMFGIVQGATFADLRRTAAEALTQIGFDGYAIGGVSVGEPEEEMFLAVEATEPFLPADKPRYAMGLGTPPQLIEMIARGIDMFDCVLPTRLARNGTAFTAQGTLNLKNAEFTLDQGPIEENCQCPACRGFSRSYVRHLIKAGEILGLRLISLHNLHCYLDLMRRARAAIEIGRFTEFRKRFLENYRNREVVNLPDE